MKKSTILLPIMLSLVCSSAFPMENESAAPKNHRVDPGTVCLGGLIATTLFECGRMGSITHRFPKTAKGITTLAQLGFSVGLGFFAGTLISNQSKMIEMHINERSKPTDTLNVLPYAIAGSSILSYILGRRAFMNAKHLKNMIKNSKK
jgi:hypothetical protein